MVSDKPILDLPQELILRISSYLTTVELGNFRRSCKNIERFLFRSFAEEFFTKRQFMFEHESLDALAGIAHHASLAQSLREVIFDMRILSPERSSDRLRFMETRQESGYLPLAQLFYSGKALAILVDIFSALPKLQCVGLRDFSGTGRFRDSSASAWTLWRGGDWNPWGWTTGGGRRHEVLQLSPIVSDILPLILLALAESGRHPEKLEILLRGRFQLGRNAFIIQYTPSILAVLDNLKTVMLNIGPKNEEEAHHAELPFNTEISGNTLAVYFSPVIRFLHHLASVEHLRLNFNVELSFGNTLLEWLSGKQLAIGSEPWTAVRFEALTMLELGFLVIPRELLVKVLVRFKLKSFALWRLNLAANPDWKGDIYNDDDNLWPAFLLDLSEQLPKPSTINRILIGHGGQVLVRRRDGVRVGREIAMISWYPFGDMPDDLQSDSIIDYKQNPQQDVHSWLATISSHTSLYTEDHSEDDELFLDEEEMDEFDDDIDDDSTDLEWLQSIPTTTVQ